MTCPLWTRGSLHHLDTQIKGLGYQIRNSHILLKLFYHLGSNLHNFLLHSAHFQEQSFLRLIHLQFHHFKTIVLWLGVQFLGLVPTSRQQEDLPVIKLLISVIIWEDLLLDSWIQGLVKKYHLYLVSYTITKLASLHSYFGPSIWEDFPCYWNLLHNCA